MKLHAGVRTRETPLRHDGGQWLMIWSART
jgi:hypothetical protein